MWLLTSVMLWVFMGSVFCFGILWPLFWQSTQPKLSTKKLAWIYAWWGYWLYMCKPLLSWSHRQRLHRAVERLGESDDYVEQVFAYQCALAAMSGVGVTALVTLSFGLSSSGLLLALLVAVLFYYYPMTLLARRLRQQQQQLQREFPFMLDLLTLSLEAGMSIHSALQLCVRQLPEQGLQRHLQMTLDELRTGVQREQAFKRFAQRAGLDEAHAFVAALLQSFELGGGLGVLLRQQAEQRRQERFLRAEKKALEAPVKMLLPLVMCIFPCTFLVIGYPLFFQLWQSF